MARKKEEDVQLNLHHHHYFSLLPLLTTIACSCLLLSICYYIFLSITHRIQSTFNDSFHVGLIAEKENVFHGFWSSSNRSKLFYGCSNASRNFITANRNTKPNRYLSIAPSGGLNQQRTGITDAVVVAYILNATLVVPKLDHESFWNDSSDFSDIFDVEWFTTYLSKDVKIIEHLPPNAGKIFTTRVPMKCDLKCYMSRVLPIFNEKRAQVVHIKEFNLRLSYWLDDEDLQKLRCRVNFHALRFSDRLREMGDKLVERMRSQSEHFVALHLRYEPDMLAFSGCYYGGGAKEREELGELRKRWKSLPSNLDPDRERRDGRCLLSPEEVGLMLRALGFGPEVHIYVASGRIYGGEGALAPLKALFRNLHSKETLASKEEMAEFSSYSTRMAALDFIVCDESEVFVANNKGNMAKILTGRRRYFGHKTTIRPNTQKLYALFLHRHNSTWREFSSDIRRVENGCMGEPNEANNRKGSFHENPLSCICKSTSSSTRINSTKN